MRSKLWLGKNIFIRIFVLLPNADLDTSGYFFNLVWSSLNIKFHANVRLIYQIAKRLMLRRIFLATRSSFLSLADSSGVSM